jgi:hypothetical protein
MDDNSQIFTNKSLTAVVESAVTFLGQSPFHEFPISTKIEGSGIYALYYSGKHKIYSTLNGSQKFGQRIPIYVGKAVPSGSRQGREQSAVVDYGIYSRLREHGRSIQDGDGIEVSDFECRFVILKDEMTLLIASLESLLIKRFQPIWNSCIDGFGNHNPGKGRYEQARSEWDTLHHGRQWAERLNNNKLTVVDITNKGINHLK